MVQGQASSSSLSSSSASSSTPSPQHLVDASVLQEAISLLLSKHELEGEGEEDGDGEGGPIGLACSPNDNLSVLKVEDLREMKAVRLTKFVADAIREGKREREREREKERERMYVRVKSNIIKSNPPQRRTSLPRSPPLSSHSSHTSPVWLSTPPLVSLFSTTPSESLGISAAIVTTSARNLGNRRD